MREVLYLLVNSHQGLMELTVGALLFKIVTSNNFGEYCIRFAELLFKPDGLIFKAAKAIWQSYNKKKRSVKNRKKKNKK